MGDGDTQGMGRPLDMEQIHEIAMVVADSLQTYIEKKPAGEVGFLEMKIGVINALECLYQYQHKVLILQKDFVDPQV